MRHTLIALITTLAFGVAAEARADFCMFQPDFYIPEPEDPACTDYQQLADEFCSQLVSCIDLDYATCVTEYLAYVSFDPGLGGAPIDEVSEEMTEELGCEQSLEYEQGMTTCTEVCGDQLCEGLELSASTCPSDCGGGGDDGDDCYVP